MVDARPDMTIAMLKEELVRLRWADAVMRGLVLAKLFAGDCEVVGDARLVIEEISPDAGVQVVFMERAAVKCSHHETTMTSLRSMRTFHSLEVPDHVKSIAPGAFRGCFSIAKVRCL